MLASQPRDQLARSADIRQSQPLPHPACMMNSSLADEVSMFPTCVHASMKAR
jgi:hypothetical protein